MYHSVTIGSYNTLTRWHLVPAGRPVINPPDPITSYVDVPGSSGGLDLTEALAGYTTYSNRTGSISFHVLNDHDTWTNIYQDIVNKIHGRKLKLVLEDDPDWYYMGRYTVSWTSNNDGTWSDVQIDYNLEPYKYNKNPVTLEGTVNGGNYTDISSSSIFGNDIAQPVIPKVSITENTTPGAWFSVKNPELNLTFNKTKSDSYPINVSNVPLYSCLLSNMNGHNNLILRAGADSGSGKYSYTITITRAML